MNKAIPITILLGGLCFLFPLQGWIDRTSPRASNGEETIYLSGSAVKKMSLGLEGLAADVYWIRTVQYFGRKLIDSGQPISAAASRNIRMDLLAPLLNVIVILDPHHMPAYRFGAIFLPERDLAAAVALLESGIRENPNEWRLYQDLAYIYWQAGNGKTGEEQAGYYARAAEWYQKGSEVPGAMWWLRDLAGYMKIAGGSREIAYAIYTNYLNSEDENVRNQAIIRLKQLRSLDDMDIINEALVQYRKATGICPTDLRPLASMLRAKKLNVNDDRLPLDPDGFNYDVDIDTCKAILQGGSTIPRM
jgi:tetratricopeptide (TPR) repeat protein